MVTHNTSFGQMTKLWSQGTQPLIEHLVFNKPGRKHRHSEFEYFFVISGSGKAYLGEREILLKAGDLLEVPPDTFHWMEPSDGQKLEAFLWYHPTRMNFLNTSL